MIRFFLVSTVISLLFMYDSSPSVASSDPAFLTWKDCSQYERVEELLGPKCAHRVRESGSIISSQGIYFCRITSQITYPTREQYPYSTCKAIKTTTDSVVFIVKLGDGSYLEKTGQFYYAPSGSWAPGSYKIKISSERVVSPEQN